MAFKPKLFHQALLLVALPLAVQLVLICMLVVEMDKIARAVRAEHDARQAVASINSIMSCFMDVSQYVGSAIFSSHKERMTLARFHTLIAPVEPDIQDLKQKLSGDNYAMNKLEKFVQEKEAAFRILDEFFNQLESGERLSGLQHLRDLRTSIASISAGLDELRDRADQLAEGNYLAQKKERQMIERILYAGLAADFIMALLLVVYFNAGTTRRLGVLMDNTKRLAQGAPLLPPVGGGDEISELDQIFKRMAVALDLAHEKERTIISSLPVGLVITDHLGSIQMVNACTMRMFGYEEEHALIGTSIFSLFQSAGNGDAAPALRPTERIEERIGLRKNGTLLPLEFSLTPFKSSSEEYFLAAMLDVTERKEIERMKQEFVAMISHDLRTPLTSIQIFLNMLCKGIFGELPEAVGKKASMADRNASRLIQLINDLLDIEKMESGQLTLNLEEISLKDTIERALESVRHLVDELGLTIERTGDEDCRVVADQGRLVQVLVNLLGNAIKFSPAHSTIEVRLGVSDQSAIVKVIDQGRGVPEHMRETIFERFKQVEHSDATEKKGTGLGLAICQTIVHQHGGTIGVVAGNGANGGDLPAGSCFWFSLPLAPAGAAVKSNG